MTSHPGHASDTSHSTEGLFGGPGEKPGTPCGVHFSSQTDLWATPDDFYQELNREFGFTLDVCALPGNAKCARYFTPEDDGLVQSWTGVCWMNPPYGRHIGKWLQRAFESSQQGAVVVCLIPARTDTKWWHDFVTQAAEVRFIKGRLHFGGSATPAPFPSAVVIFRPRPETRTKWARAFFRKQRGEQQAVEVLQ
jgi:phage N-6-adenine-methyltransferase